VLESWKGTRGGVSEVGQDFFLGVVGVEVEEGEIFVYHYQLLEGEWGV
jgi:hypothetical protein